MSDDEFLKRWLHGWSNAYDAAADSVLDPIKGSACIDLDALITISAWKLRRLWPGQAERRLRQNDEAVVKDLTQRAIGNKDDVAALALLTLIHGLAPRSASAVLTAADPERFTVMDIRSWNSLKALSKSGYVHLPNRTYAPGAKGWAQYWPDHLSACRSISDSTSCSLREVDRALFSANGDPSLPA